jgi:GNAT superfamily N-acetyltransferase
MPELSIRCATPDDLTLILDFVKELADYEKALHEVKATTQDLRSALFGEHAKAYCVICESDGKPAGFALYFYNFSTWLGKFGLFLEDLYVTPSHRGTGAGKALLKHLAKLAVDNDCGRFEWNVLDWNEPSIKFYESFGAKPQSEWIGYRLSGQALADFAAE